MLICMRTTIILPDDLYTTIKRTAADESRTVTSVIEEALRAAMRARQERREAPAYVVAPIAGRGVQPGVDLHDSAALADLMDER